MELNWDKPCETTHTKPCPNYERDGGCGTGCGLCLGKGVVPDPRPVQLHDFDDFNNGHAITVDYGVKDGTHSWRDFICLLDGFVPGESWRVANAPEKPYISAPCENSYHMDCRTLDCPCACHAEPRKGGDYHYSGDGSKQFWERVNSFRSDGRTPNNEAWYELYSLGVDLQNRESVVLKTLREAEREAKPSEEKKVEPMPDLADIILGLIVEMEVGPTSQRRTVIEEARRAVKAEREAKPASEEKTESREAIRISTKRYRQGRKVKLNVYDGERPMFQAHYEEDAKCAVDALNRDHSDTTAQAELDKLMAYAREKLGRRDVQSLYEVIDELVRRT